MTPFEPPGLPRLAELAGIVNKGRHGDRVLVEDHLLDAGGLDSQLAPMTGLRRWIALVEADRSRGGYTTAQARAVGDCAIVAMSIVTGLSWDTVFSAAQPRFGRYGLNPADIARTMRDLGWGMELYTGMPWMRAPITVRRAAAHLQEHDPTRRLICTIAVNRMQHAIAFADGRFHDVRGAEQAKLRSADACWPMRPALTEAGTAPRQVNPASPARLFHGTSSARLPAIEAGGLTPQSSRDNPGRRAIYLTDDIESAWDYAELACLRDEDDGAVRRGVAAPILLEIITGLLDPNAFEPDDYELRDALAGREAYAGVPRHPDLGPYQVWREVPWPVSLAVTQQVVYTKPIPRAAIRLHRGAI